MISLHVDVRDPPFALPPPQAEFGETIKYEESLQLTSLEASPALESSGASLIYIFPKHKSPKVSMTPRLSTPIENIAAVDVSQEKSFEPSAEQDKTGRPRSSTPGTKLKVLKNRRSLQSLFVSPFLHNQSSVAHPATTPPKSLSRARSQSAPRHHESLSTVASLKSKSSTSTLVPRSVSPSTFFIDEDPFANICTPPSVTGHHKPPAPTSHSPPSTTTGTDPGPDEPAETTLLPPLSAPSTPPVVTHRPKSSSHAQARGAYTKPAFTSRPSLPSLHTLAQMNVMIPKKTRRGTVGAGLPYEPWNMDLDQLKLTQTRQPKSPNSSSTGHTKVPSIADFTLGLGGDVSESVRLYRCRISTVIVLHAL
ncbi:hypothetical protein PILCRDRAFT_2702 [Piloderma croceum F 1598]|uniref:Uncharacterized protein n=1 Tax=Piloderma croceum (strain F 1598) TaxID=765440 RepID=A0A0C3CI96_PILCF|nr:hypothetical protein PILCRDRAFT_2702 [Piloderma croceum F 1598]